jgi:curved DNA-binding protein CbpA
VAETVGNLLLSRVDRVTRADKDPYALLGVTRAVTPAELRRAYRRRVVVSHRSGVLGLKEHLGELEQAYVLLRDPITRARYESAPRQAPLPEHELLARNRREAELRSQTARVLAEQSRQLGHVALHANAELVRRLADEHTKRAETDQRRRERRARQQRAIQIMLWLLALAAAGMIATLTR